MLNSKQVQLEKMHIDDNGADMLTKMMTRAKLDIYRRLSSMTADRQ
jgi:hypothetical protein